MSLLSQVVINMNLDTRELPLDLQKEYANLTMPNRITKKLRTLPLG